MNINCDKFPLALRRKLESGQVKLPDAIMIDYDPIKAYRCIVREQGDVYSITRRDMMSYAELGKKPPKTLKGGVNNPDYYSTSFFTSFDVLKNTMAFPNPRKRAIVGYIHPEGGPQLYNQYTTHVSWWMYEDADFSSFIVLEESDG